MQSVKICLTIRDFCCALCSAGSDGKDCAELMEFFDNNGEIFVIGEISILMVSFGSLDKDFWEFGGSGEG